MGGADPREWRVVGLKPVIPAKAGIQQSPNMR
jgi:hypothetical protein